MFHYMYKRDSHEIVKCYGFIFNNNYNFESAIIWNGSRLITKCIDYLIPYEELTVEDIKNCSYEELDKFPIIVKISPKLKVFFYNNFTAGIKGVNKCQELNTDTFM